MKLKEISVQIRRHHHWTITTVTGKYSFLRPYLGVTHLSLLSFQSKVRSVLRPSQFGGQPCTEPLVTFQPCIPSKLCKIEEADCKNKFHCDSGNVLLKNVQSPLKVT